MGTHSSVPRQLCSFGWHRWALLCGQISGASSDPSGQSLSPSHRQPFEMQVIWSLQANCLGLQVLGASRAAATRAESRGSSSSGGGVSMVWADASSSPSLRSCSFSPSCPPQLGGPPFPSPLLLLYSYSFLRQSVPGAWVKRDSSEPFGGGPADAGAPPAPKSKPSAPRFTPRSSLPLPRRSSQPHLGAASGCKNAQLGGGGVGGGGRGPGRGAFGGA